MDDLIQKLANVLNDPDSMERVRKMAENILGESSKSDRKEGLKEDLGSVLGNGELQSIMSIIGRLKASGNDPRAQLLTALKPHLSEPRRDKVDTAIKILKMLELLPYLRESGILNL